MIKKIKIIKNKKLSVIKFQMKNGLKDGLFSFDIGKYKLYGFVINYYNTLLWYEKLIQYPNKLETYFAISKKGNMYKIYYQHFNIKIFMKFISFAMNYKITELKIKDNYKIYHRKHIKTISNDNYIEHIKTNFPIKKDITTNNNYLLIFGTCKPQFESINQLLKKIYYNRPKYRTINSFFKQDGTLIIPFDEYL